VPISQLRVAAQCCISPSKSNVFAIISTLFIFATATFGATLVVPAGGDLQAAINTAAAGDTILLEAGATYVGPFTLPVKSGSSYITIQSSGLALLPPDGQRVTPANASAMPKLVSPGSGSPVLQTASAAHHFSFVGIEFMPRDASAFVYDVIMLGTGTQSTLAEVPHHLIFDRCYIHAHPGQGIKRGVALNSAFTEIRNSYISDFKVVAQDSQAICSWNGPGPFQITNNYLEAAAENVMFGGADPSIPNRVPSDITIVNNSFFKPLSWRVGDPSYAGTHWSVKNLLEVKNAQRVTINGNTFENNWADAQDGYAILFTPRNQTGKAPWTVVQDVEFTNNIIRHSGRGIQILGSDTYQISQQTQRIKIENNLFEDINGAWGDGKFAVMASGGDQVSFNHNTILQTGHIMQVYANPRTGLVPTTNFLFTNNITLHNQYGVVGDNVGSGNASLTLYMPRAIFSRNVIVGNVSSDYPTNNYYPSLLSRVQFVDYAKGNYRLAAGSPYKRLATDGKDIGCDFNLLGFTGS
jgi:hypothetical protein